MVPSLLRSLSVVPLFSAIGCGALLGISPSDSQGEDEDGRGGTSPAGSGGHATGGGAGEGGAGDSSGGTGEAGDLSTGGTGEAGSLSTGGTGEAGSLSTGGSDGRGGNGGSTAGGSSGMGGGAGGEGGNDASDFPQPGDPCSASGALACWFTKPDEPKPTTLRLECDRGTWVKTPENCPDTASDPRRCDRRDGTCAHMLCGEHEPPGERRPHTCYNSLVDVCGPDLVTIEHEPCVLGCDGTNDCRAARPRELVIDRPRSVSADENPWPERLIPICWREFPVDDAAIIEARAAVRVAVESLWSRESVVGFTGWESCDPSQARVELDLADECKGELARIPRDGYPGAGAALPVTICKSYYDSDETNHSVGTDPSELEQLGFVAQHVFGHVLGFEDVVIDVDRGRYFMDPVLDRAAFPQLRPELWLIEDLARWYGNAPGRSLVSPDGRCLSYDSETSVLLASACDGSGAQAWEPRDNALAHASGKCVSGPANGGTIEIAECSAEPLEEKEWLPARVRIHDRLGYCLKAGTLPNDLALEWVNCDATWPAEQRFRFEFVGSGHVRIHTTHTTPERCIVAPQIWTQSSTEPSFPGFGSCDGVRDVFDAFDGTLGQEGRCLTPTQTPFRVGLIVFEPCGTASNQQFRLSGPFERDGHALTFPMGEQPVELTSSPLGPIPAPDQILDYRF